MSTSRLPFGKPPRKERGPRAFNSTVRITAGHQPAPRAPLARSRKPIRKVNPEAKARRTRAFNARLHRADWKSLRLACFERDGFRCTQTGCDFHDQTRTGKGLIADHITYARFGHEQLTDLRTVCRSCDRQGTIAERANWQQPRRGTR